jgi:hypothetical protein
VGRVEEVPARRDEGVEDLLRPLGVDRGAEQVGAEAQRAHGEIGSGQDEPVHAGLRRGSVAGGRSDGIWPLWIYDPIKLGEDGRRAARDGRAPRARDRRRLPIPADRGLQESSRNALASTSSGVSKPSVKDP